MADAITIKDASGALVDISVDDVGTLNGGTVSPTTHIQRFKLVFGGDGVGTDASATAPLPVTVGNLPATQPVSAAALPLPVGAAQEHATAASPASARLSDGTTYLGSTAQRLWVDDGGQSLTVDAVALPLPTGAATDASLTNGTAQFRYATPGSAAVTNVAASASSVTLAAANAGRRGLSVFNDGTANLYIKHGATASTASFTVKVAAGGLYELPAPYYRGVVDGIWDVANGSARVTELS